MCEDKKRNGVWVGMVLAALSIAMPASAAWVSGFGAITNNSGLATSLASQYSVAIEEVNGFVEFTFSNNYADPIGDSISSTITKIYWDWDPNNAYFNPSTAFYYDDVGVTWALDPGRGNVNPGNLPAGNNIQFVADAAAGESNRGLAGVTLGDSVTFGMAYRTGFDWGMIETALNAGNIRFGMHVQSINGGTSDSFFSPPDDPGPGDPPFPPDTVVPLPGAAGLAMLGLGFVAVLRRKKQAD